MEAMTKENLLIYVPIHVKLSDFWVAWVVRILFDAKLRVYYWTADFAKGSVRKSRHKAGRPVTTRKGRDFIFAKLMAKSVMCGDMIDICVVPITPQGIMQIYVRTGREKAGTSIPIQPQQFAYKRIICG